MRTEDYPSSLNQVREMQLDNASAPVEFGARDGAGQTVGVGGDAVARALADPALQRFGRRFAYAIAGANVLGAVDVFLLLQFVLPFPRLENTTLALLLNAGLFVVYLLVSVPLIWLVMGRLWEERLGWVDAGRVPSARERELTLRFPVTVQKVCGAGWLLAAVVFTALNVPFSGEVAFNVGITIVLGGLVTSALGYLLAERRLRPITAIALAAGVPRRPQLPGVAARALLSWVLGAGSILLGIALVGIGGLHEPRFTAERLSIAVLVLSVVGMVVGLIMMLGLARSLADPIEALRRAVGLVERGDLEHEVAVNDASEVGLLQAGFNRMLAGLRERERLRDLFGRQVGEDVARQALERGVELGGEAREATVLFVDLAGSTRLAETRDPADVVSLLNEFFAIVVEVVASHGGFVNKFEGDAALCIFGAPLPDNDAASRALATARILCARLEEELEGVVAGIGVSSGRVVAGNIGAAERFEYTVIGDPVNEASRLTDLAKARPERLLVSEAALGRADPQEVARWELCDELKLRGRSALTRVAVARAGERASWTGTAGST